MIISRRKFEEEINKAVMQREEELWQRRNHDEEVANLYRRLDALEERVRRLEPVENRPHENITYYATRA